MELDNKFSKYLKVELLQVLFHALVQPHLIV